MEANEPWGKAQFHETESYNLIRKSKVKVEIKFITPSNTAHLWVVYHSENLKKYKFSLNIYGQPINFCYMGKEILQLTFS